MCDYVHAYAHGRECGNVHVYARDPRGYGGHESMNRNAPYRVHHVLQHAHRKHSGCDLYENAHAYVNERE